MLFYNPNIRRKTTYKRLPLFGELKDRNLYSYSIYDDYEVKEILFDEKKVKCYKYNRQNAFLDSLEIYNEKNEMERRYYFDITANGPNQLEFKESSFKRTPQVGCRGKLLKSSVELGESVLTFHRVDSFLGYRIKLNISENKNGDYLEEAYFDIKQDKLLYVLENEFEYYENELEQIAKNILNKGWGETLSAK